LSVSPQEFEGYRPLLCHHLEQRHFTAPQLARLWRVLSLSQYQPDAALCEVLFRETLRQTRGLTDRDLSLFLKATGKLAFRLSEEQFEPFCNKVRGAKKSFTSTNFFMCVCV
jgi:hypothetical protein